MDKPLALLRLSLSEDTTRLFLRYLSGLKYTPSKGQAPGADLYSLLRVDSSDPLLVDKILAVSVGKNVHQRLDLVLESIFSDPASLAANTVLARVITSQKYEISGATWATVAHVSVAKNVPVFLERILHPILGTIDDNRSDDRGKTVIGLAAAALHYGPSRLGAELRAGATQALIIEALRGRLGPGTAAALTAALWLDSVLYIPSAIAHYKRGGILGAELAEAIMAAGYEALADELEEAARRSKDYYLELLYGAEKRLDGLVGFLQTLPRNTGSKGPEPRVLKTWLEKAGQALFPPGPRGGRDPLLGRLYKTNLLDLIGVAKKMRDWGSLIIILTGQTSGPLVDYIAGQLGVEEVGLVYTPYTLVNYASTRDYLESKGKGQVYGFPASDIDAGVTRLMGAAAGKALKGRILVVAQGAMTVVNPFLRGLADSGADFRVVLA